MSIQELEPPIKRYLMGAKPRYSLGKNIAENFAQISQDLIKNILINNGYMEDTGKATVKAAEDELISVCEKKIIWNLEKLQEFLESGGMKPQRVAVNQKLELNDEDGEVQWANLGTLSTYFGTTPHNVGKWLEALDLKTSTEPTKLAIDSGYVTSFEMNAGGKKTRTVYQWNLRLTIERLMSEGHELNIDYEESLKGKGKNGDVKVLSNLDERTKEFAKKFASLYRNPATRRQCKNLVEHTPLIIIKKAEIMMKRPGFIRSNEYLKGAE